MIYLLMVQTETERGRVTRAFRELVYDALASGPGHQHEDGAVTRP